jgi:hypothetical protein
MSDVSKMIILFDIVNERDIETVGGNFHNSIKLSSSTSFRTDKRTIYFIEVFD